ncbi:hypothetical protein K435DRAFT_471956 [Dendrothele bispora CBS 962.96]|uniref:Uncharacterized protein n=1 Tax=Dendrothele bispora (strain CBS 962.96) TaxID=1314807 RepID=A0A4S8KZL6_DENBC|nr:hypothetical protein K435DRAFT_471956 [Dendrothele bispora CBS 962.96]
MQPNTEEGSETVTITCASLYLFFHCFRFCFFASSLFLLRILPCTTFILLLGLVKNKQHAYTYMLYHTMCLGPILVGSCSFSPRTSSWLYHITFNFFFLCILELEWYTYVTIVEVVRRIHFVRKLLVTSASERTVGGLLLYQTNICFVV